ncbi:MAG TPA: hypothetical protein VFW98_10760 [Gemmatimonadaceae bacterium]|nr:hypothetical protein [Gemmatimonadaceae bacterium]
MSGAAVGVLIAAVGMRVFSSAAAAPPWARASGRGVAAWIGVVVLTALVAIAVHEGGHALGGRLAGFQLVAFVVGPVQLVRGNAGGRLGLNRHIQHVGGLVVCAPTTWTGAADFRRAFRWFAAAGPLTSLVVGAVAMAAAASGTPGSLWTSILFVGGLISLACGVGTLVPFHMAAGFYSDGAQVLRFREPNARAGKRLGPLAEISALTMFAQTQPPREWDAELVATVGGITEQTELGVTARILRYHLALDRGDVADARDVLQGTIDAAATLATATADRTRGLLAVEAAVFEGVWRRDAGAARRWLERAGRVAALDPVGRLLAMAGMAAAEGADGDARHMLDRAAKVARHSTFPSAALLCAPTVERLDAALE